MVMNSREIFLSYNSAYDKSTQLEILAQLNGCSKVKIESILKEQKEIYDMENRKYNDFLASRVKEERPKEIADRIKSMLKDYVPMEKILIQVYEHDNKKSSDYHYIRSLKKELEEDGYFNVKFQTFSSPKSPSLATREKSISSIVKKKGKRNVVKKVKDKC